MVFSIRERGNFLKVLTGNRRLFAVADVIRAYRALPGFKGQSAVGTWLHRIAVNVCLNRVSSKAPAIEPAVPAHE